ncbi:Periplasmic divalent cation tolerance protein CutA [Hyphomicrobium sulfonivorans]|uniref:Periplasmic divalent cation tolerance protein CutA n=1 Tax=Hyphomicrobium sulfonivorans TaxID=121290 RepID=A0A109BAC4_HYPSL|nr:Periplasmic divalent cation tolerance protein CutA [Hyphomicrobium sulfonivorans]
MGRLAQVQQNDKPVLVYSTFPSAEVAEQVARELIERRLVACVNILPGMTSIYRWDGAINRDSEVVAIIKTRSQLAAKVMQEVAARHPYDNPALLVIEVADGGADYLKWLMTETARPD